MSSLRKIAETEMNLEELEERRELVVEELNYLQLLKMTTLMKIIIQICFVMK